MLTSKLEAAPAAVRRDNEDGSVTLSNVPIFNVEWNRNGTELATELLGQLAETISGSDITWRHDRNTVLGMVGPVTVSGSGLVAELTIYPQSKAAEFSSVDVPDLIGRLDAGHSIGWSVGLEELKESNVEWVEREDGTFGLDWGGAVEGVELAATPVPAVPDTRITAQLEAMSAKLTAIQRERDMSDKDKKPAPANLEAQNATLTTELASMRVELAAQREDAKLAREGQDAISVRLEAQIASTNATAAVAVVRSLGRAGYRFKDVTEAVKLATKNPEGFKAHMALLEPDPGLAHARTPFTGPNADDEPGDSDPTVMSKQAAAAEFIAARRAGKSKSELEALGAKLEAACAKGMYQ